MYGGISLQIALAGIVPWGNTPRFWRFDKLQIRLIVLLSSSPAQEYFRSLCDLSDWKLCYPTTWHILTEERQEA